MSTKPKTTHRNQDGKPALVPKLRFPEFRNAEGWEEKTIGHVCRSFSGGTPSTSQKAFYGGSIPFIRSAEIGRAQTELFLTAEGVNNSAAKLVAKGDVLVALYGANSGDVALSRIDGAINQAILCLKSGGSNAFIYQFLSYKQRWIISTYLQGGQGNLSGEIVKSIPLGLPAPPEQQKIAECLSSVDDLVAAQARKLDALKTHKKGLMQQLFPREGETQPRLRFPEFQNAGEWVQIELGEKVDLLSGYPFDGPDISQDSNGIRLLRGINVTEGRIRHNPEIDRYYTGSTDGLEKFRVQTNDLVIGMDGSKVGKNSALVSESDAGALLIQRVARLRAKNPALIRFIFQRIHSTAFHSYVDRINTSSGIPHISAKQIKEFQICFPSDAEQQRVGDCLTTLDDLITAQTRKLEALKTHKKGLMQQLFPSPEANEG